MKKENLSKLHIKMKEKILIMRRITQHSFTAVVCRGGGKVEENVSHFFDYGKIEHSSPRPFDSLETDLCFSF